MLKIDLHLHTIMSGHAQCTVYEYIERAKKLKMKVIGFADHGPGNSCFIGDRYYYDGLSRIPDLIDGIRVLKGVEANINNKGEIDVTEKMLERLDYVIAFIHDETDFKDKGKVNNTKAVIKAIKSGKINILSHPFLMKFGLIDIITVSECACENNVLLEVNNTQLTPKKLEKFPDSLDNIIKMIKVVKSYGRKLIVNSDAHNIWHLGNDSDVRKLMKKIGLTDKMIINNYPKELFSLLNIK